MVISEGMEKINHFSSAETQKLTLPSAPLQSSLLSLYIQSLYMKSTSVCVPKKQRFPCPACFGTQQRSCLAPLVSHSSHHIQHLPMAIEKDREKTLQGADQGSMGEPWVQASSVSTCRWIILVHIQTVRSLNGSYQSPLLTALF